MALPPPPERTPPKPRPAPGGGRRDSHRPRNPPPRADAPRPAVAPLAEALANPGEAAGPAGLGWRSPGWAPRWIRPGPPPRGGVAAAVAGPEAASLAPRRAVCCGTGAPAAAGRPDHGARRAARAPAAAPRTGECGLRPAKLAGPGPSPARLRTAPLPRERADAGRTPQTHGQVKLVQRAGRARAGGGAHCGPRLSAAPRPAVRLHPSPRLLRRPRLPAVAARPGPAAVLTRAAPRPSGPGAARCALPGCRWRPGLRLRSTHDARGCPASGTFTCLPVPLSLALARIWHSPACPPPRGQVL